MSDVKGSLNQSMIDRRNAIADAADLNRADDLDPIDDEVQAAAADPEADEPEAQHEEEPESKAKPERYKLKVNGKEEEVSVEELIARAQKVAAADDYLEQAKNAFRQTLEQKLEPESKPAAEKDWKALARALQMGTEDEAAEVLRQFGSQPSAPPADVVSKLVDEKLSVRDAAAKFGQEYKDVLENPKLMEIFNLKEAALIANGDKASNLERWKSIGDELREFIPKSSTDKLARKAAVATVPTAAGRQRASMEADEEDSPSDVIAKIAKSRGQARVTH